MDIQPWGEDPLGEEDQAPVIQEGVPWTSRDVWFAVGALGLWMIGSIVLSLLLRESNWDVDAGGFLSLAELALLLPVWWFSLRKYGVGWDALGLRPFGAASVGVGCGLMLGSFLFNFVYNLTLSVFDLTAQADWVTVFSELSSPWLLLLGGVIIAPLAEEILFRGFIFAGLRQRYGWKPAALISAGLFAAVHLSPLSVPPLFLLGWIFAYLYHRSNSIWPAILMHVLTNGLALGAAYLLSQFEGGML